MRTVWLEWTRLENPTPEEVCRKGVTTPRGTFVFVTDEKVHKPEAIKRCNEMGAILAPITEREDFDKLFEFANKCRWYRMPRTYWLGYEAHSNDTRLFSNGEVWDWEKHTKIYSKMHDVGKKCTMHIFNTLQPSHVFVSGSNHGLCGQAVKDYICLKPAAPKCAESIVQKSGLYDEKLACSMLANGVFFVLVSVLVALLIKKRK